MLSKGNGCFRTSHVPTSMDANNYTHEENAKESRRSNVNADFQFWFVRDFPSLCLRVEGITFLPQKPGKRGQNAETVFTDLLTIFAQDKSESFKFTIFLPLFSVTACCSSSASPFVRWFAARSRFQFVSPNWAKMGGHAQGSPGLPTSFFFCSFPKIGYVAIPRLI